MKDLEKEIELLEKKVRLLKELRELESPTRIEFVPCYYPIVTEPPKPSSPQPWTQPWPGYPNPYIGDLPGYAPVVTC